MRIHPKAKAKGARNKFARHASNKQNGLGKYQQTGLLVSFWRTSQRQVLDRAQPPTLQQGGSPMLMVLLGWTLAAIFRSGSVYGSVLLRFGQEYLVRSVAHSTTWDSRQRSLGLPWKTCAKGQFRYGEAAPGSLRSDRRWTTNFAQTRTLPNRLKSPSCFSRTPRQGPGAARRPNPWFENTCDFGVWPAPEIRLPSYSGPPRL